MNKININAFKTLFLFVFICSCFFSQCDFYQYKSIEIGEDFLDLETFQNIDICEGDGYITAGQETFYIQQAYINDKKELVYDIQEAQGNWPTIGYFKLSKDFSLMQVKFMGAIATYNITKN
jgi:hypothetical protein